MKNLMKTVICVGIIALVCYVCSADAAAQSAPAALRTPAKAAGRNNSSSRYQALFDSVGTRCYPGLVSLADAAKDFESGNQAALRGNRSGGRAAVPAAFSPATQRSSKRAVSAVDQLALLSDIEMARFKDGELTIIGPAATPGNAFRPDDWFAVFKSITGPEAPGVSIDPSSDPALMQVRYFGGIESSHLGQSFFEADRTLKLMSTGFDNYSCSLWPARPREIPTEFELAFGEEARQGTAHDGSKGWHRFWFEPSNNPVETDGLAMRIPRDRLIVKEESVPPGSPSPKSAGEFAAEITNNFHSLSGRIPAFAELQRQAALIALAKWIRDKRVPVDGQWLRSADNSTAAPRTTPSITVVNATITDRAYLSLGIHGGVDFQKENQYGAGSEQMRRLWSTANSTRAAGKSSWAFSFQGQEYRGIGIPVRDLKQLEPHWSPWKTDSSTNLIQPNSYSEPVPNGNLAVRNQGPEEVNIHIGGSLTRNEHLAPHTTATLRVVPGNYNLRIESKCGTKDYFLQVKEGESPIVEYFCGPAAANAPPHRADGVFEIQNQTGSPLLVIIGAESHQVPLGVSEIHLSPGGYVASVTSTCGSTSEHLDVVEDSKFIGKYSCERH